MEEALLEDALHLHPVYPGLPWSPDSERHCIIVERGARYRAYSELRESKLRMKHLGFGKQQEQGKEVEDRHFKLTPVRKQENRKPSNRAFELTPPSKIGARVNSFGANARGSKSASAGEKKRGGLMTRRSCANLDELKGLATAARNAIKVHHPNNFRRQIDLANGLQ